MERVETREGGFDASGIVSGCLSDLLVTFSLRFWLAVRSPRDEVTSGSLFTDAMLPALELPCNNSLTGENAFLAIAAVVDATRFLTGVVGERGEAMEVTLDRVDPLGGGEVAPSTFIFLVSSIEDVLPTERRGLLTSCCESGLFTPAAVILARSALFDFLDMASPSILWPCSPIVTVFGASIARKVCTSNLPSSLPIYRVAPSGENARDVTGTL